MNSKLLVMGVVAGLAIMVGIATTSENTFAKNRVNSDNNTLATVTGPDYGLAPKNKGNFTNGQ
jgi:hypothetical protein